MNRCETTQPEESPSKDEVTTPATEEVSTLPQLAWSATGILGGLASMLWSVPQMTVFQSLAQQVMSNFQSDTPDITLNGFSVFEANIGETDANPSPDRKAIHQVFMLGATTANWPLNPLSGTKCNPIDRGRYCTVKHMELNMQQKTMETEPYCVGVNSFSRIACLCEKPERLYDMLAHMDHAPVSGQEYVIPGKCQSFAENTLTPGKEANAGQFYEVTLTDDVINNPPDNVDVAVSCDFYGIVFKVPSGDASQDHIFQNFASRKWTTQVLTLNNSMPLNLDTNVQWCQAYSKDKALESKVADLNQIFGTANLNKSAAKDCFIVTAGPRIENWTAMTHVPKTAKEMNILTTAVSGLADFFGRKLDENEFEHYDAARFRSVTRDFNPKTGYLKIQFPLVEPNAASDPIVHIRARMFDTLVDELKIAKLAHPLTFIAATGEAPRSSEGNIFFIKNSDQPWAQKIGEPKGQPMGTHPIEASLGPTAA